MHHGVFADAKTKACCTGVSATPLCFFGTGGSLRVTGFLATNPHLSARAKALETSSGMHQSFQSFTSAYKLSPGSISYSDFVIVRLLYEATRDAARETFPIRTPLAETLGVRLAKPPLLVPVLRAGLGMVDQALALLPEARVGFVGVARDEETAQPMPYLESLPDDLSGQPVMVLDPMVATGGSITYTIGLLLRRGATDITVLCVVAAPEGLAAVEKMAPQVRLFTAAVDDGLNEISYIVPGLGDAGDRQFGPR